MLQLELIIRIEKCGHNVWPTNAQRFNQFPAIFVLFRLSGTKKKLLPYYGKVPDLRTVFDATRFGACKNNNISC